MQKRKTLERLYLRMLLKFQNGVKIIVSKITVEKSKVEIFIFVNILNNYQFRNKKLVFLTSSYQTIKKGFGWYEVGFS